MIGSFFPTVHPKFFPLLCAYTWLVVSGAVPGGAQTAPPQSRIDFTRDIQPILAGNCIDCHGTEKPKGGLQLTSLKLALKGGESGDPVIVPGQSAKSALIARVTTDDDEDVMPQKSDRLPPAKIALLKRWIDEGALWPEDVKHWAYVKPVRPPLPAVRNPAVRPRNPIDHFVFARLEQEGMSPSPETDKPRWLRRVSLDLIGLPPTLAEIEAFLADNSEQAHERVVDRLLASPQYGERWARPWLDLARYADSHGFQKDDLRDLWPYRDWVIRAMNTDLPFDQFTTWQIAGDLLPEVRATKTGHANLDPLIATGFHRASPTNVEAGTDQEEGRVNQVFDRVNTTAAVWLGSTLECAQCHNHKYDPFSQKEYYQLFAYFNQTAQETELLTPTRVALKFTGPFIELPDPEKEAKRKALQERMREINQQVAARTAEVRPGFAAWEQTAIASLDTARQTHPLDLADFTSTGGSVHKTLPDKSVLLVDDAPDADTYIVNVNTTLTGITGFKLEALADPSLPGSGPGRGDAARPNFVLNDFTITAAAAGAKPEPVKLVQATASHSQARFSVENLLKTDNGSRGGWAIGLQYHRDHWAVFETAQPLGSAAGTTLTFTLAQNAGAGRTIGRLRLSALTGATGGPPLPAEIAVILREPKPTRTTAQEAKLEAHFLSQDKALAALTQTKSQLTRETTSLKGAQTLVMRELDQPRVTALMNRGSFLDPGERVEAGTPAVLHPLRVAPARTVQTADAGGGAASHANRLDLARWLVDPENPLVARVTVNRWWSEFFGRGIVSTPEDFGVKGEAPTHPELLDWLAVEFVEGGWSMKKLHRTIVLSATYRQSSRVTPEQLARDDQNKLFARGPRFRLDAETIRDNALRAAGLLSLKQGGPPVRPYQPPGLWESKVGGDKVTYDLSTGEDAWRRGVYTVWKRSSPYPSFMNFDASARTACTIRRSRSNTPLQALTLLNDPVYVEAAMALAKRVLTECADSAVRARLDFAFQLCVTRTPAPQEVAALQRLYEHQRAVYAADPKAAKTVVGKFTVPAGLSVEELAAWHAVATALLNLDEMITKG